MSISSSLLFDIDAVRRDFPVLNVQANGRLIAYLDNASTSQKPMQVINAMDRFWTEQNANVHRGVHHLSQVATAEFEAARESVYRLLNAASTQEIIFTKGCTESVNLVAQGLSSTGGSRDTGSSQKAWIESGDEILVSQLEHHSNIVPWQLAAQRAGASVKVVPLTDEYEIDLHAYAKLLRSGRVKVVAIVHISNSIGTVNPIREMVDMAREVGALVLVDGAQAGPHTRIDVQELAADFYTVSGHKVYGPTGIGVLYGKTALLESLPAYQGGGDMIRTVSFSKGTTYATLPAKFEAGTPNIAGAIGLGAAVKYLENFDSQPLSQTQGDPLKSTFQRIGQREKELVDYGAEKLGEIPGLKLYGSKKHRASILSFTLSDAHAHDVGTILDMEGIAVRTGHHCCMPLMEYMGVAATTRASISFYNTKEEIDRLVTGIRKVQEMFAR